MEIQGHKPIQIDGKEYWSVKQFSELTQRTEFTIRFLTSKGNAVRKLRSEKINGRKYILKEELFDYPFVANGRPPEEGRYIEKFYVDPDTKELLRSEEILFEEEKSEE